MLNALLLSLTNHAARAIPLAVAAALAVMATAQINLVPNPSFEDTARCNAEYDPVLLSAPPWFNVNWATPDIYDNDLEDPCGIAWDPADPDVQGSGFQYARTGTRFAGAYHWYGANGSDTKDYITVKLTEALTVQTVYDVSLYYSRADGFALATDRISVYFGPDSFYVHDYRTLQVQPQVDLMDPDNQFLTNADDWVLLKGSFTAAGDERYMTIGSFLDSSQVVGTVAPTGNLSYAYYYYDDVRVAAGSQSGIGELDLSGTFLSDGNLRLAGLPDAEYSVRVMDPVGRVVQELSQVRSMAGHADIALGEQDMAEGLYVAVVWSRKERGSVRFIFTGRQR
ncbi:MAG: hypothetical protein KDC01_04760 [Flavobacteriales bacterium]|jgi:hypothetical protein|nr:hypothetical protein [Flavobacteriales bacterium]